MSSNDKKSNAGYETPVLQEEKKEQNIYSHLHEESAASLDNKNNIYDHLPSKQRQKEIALARRKLPPLPFENYDLASEENNNGYAEISEIPLSQNKEEFQKVALEEIGITQDLSILSKRAIYSGSIPVLIGDKIRATLDEILCELFGEEIDVHLALNGKPILMGDAKENALRENEQAKKEFLNSSKNDQNHESLAQNLFNSSAKLAAYAIIGGDENLYKESRDDLEKSIKDLGEIARSSQEVSKHSRTSTTISR